ncbi:MAG: alpha/beta fold hydrolase [Chloroflexi bacterium]|nr:alpha/beta fold hydrolase [Chloroflexota bacterium]
MASIFSKVIRVGRLRIRYFTGGHGEPLVVLHGGADGARSWLKNAAELSKYYRVYIPDLPGFGHSQPLSSDFRIPEYVSFVDDFSRSLGLERFNLVGHSMGGRIAIGYALKHPQRIKKLVLVSSIGLGKEIALWARVSCWLLGRAVLGILRAAKWLLRGLRPGRWRKDPGFSLKIGRSLMNLKGQAQVIVHQLSNLLMPTLLVWGANDLVLPVSHGYAASRVIPDCELRVLEGCGHSVYKQKIAEFSRVLSTFLG